MRTSPSPSASRISASGLYLMAASLTASDTGLPVQTAIRPSLQRTSSPATPLAEAPSNGRLNEASLSF